MKSFKFLLIACLGFFVVSSAAIASDFGWTRDFNIQAQADPSEFRARLATRFNLRDIQVIAMLSIFDSPADAYIMLRLGEIQGMLKGLSREQSVAAIKKYRHNKDKGWGALAKSLGVKPGSEEFHALKKGHDLHGGSNNAQVLYSAYDHSNVNYVDNHHDKNQKQKKSLKN
jgi:hypothetical protein